VSEIKTIKFIAQWCNEIKKAGMKGFITTYLVSSPEIESSEQDEDGFDEVPRGLFVRIREANAPVTAYVEGKIDPSVDPTTRTYDLEKFASKFELVREGNRQYTKQDNTIVPANTYQETWVRRIGDDALTAALNIRTLSQRADVRKQIETENEIASSKTEDLDIAAPGEPVVAAEFTPPAGAVKTPF
jgi:hypothetical protein